jgi:hypothetical protein
MRRRTVVATAVALVVGAGLVVGAVVAFPSGTVGRVAAGGQQQLPASMAPSMFGLCDADLDDLGAEMVVGQSDGSPSQAGTGTLAFSIEGSGASFAVSVREVGVWRVDASRAGVTLVNENSTLDPAAVSAHTSAAVAYTQQLYECLSRYRFVDETTSLASSSQLVQWYKYDALVLWPCLTAHGLKVGDPPSRADFSDPFRAQGVDPFQGLTVSRRTLPQLLAAVRECPVHPSYLR